MNILHALLPFAVLFSLLLVAMTIHEFAHSWVAYRLGDVTAKYQGRLTLNPFAHIDIFWTVLLPFLLFLTTGFFIAAAKPVPINYASLRNPKKDIIWIGLAGPLANFALAIVLAILWRMLPPASITDFLLTQLVFINVMLGVFNLVPIPPLDGSRVVMGLLPDELALSYAKLEPYGFMIIVGLLMLGALNKLIWPVIISVMRLLGIPLAPF